MSRAAVNSINKKQQMKIGYFGGAANKQYEYDHKDDCAIYLDKPFVERKLGVLKVSYGNLRSWPRGTRARRSWRCSASSLLCRRTGRRPLP